MDKMKMVGHRYFDETPVTVTDPCYNAGTWCTVKNIHVKPGQYDLIMYLSNTGDWGTRVTRAMILHSGCGTKPVWLFRQYIGDAGVDAGLCGFYQNKPDYDDEAWGKFCEAIRNADYLITPEGFCTSSGYGDGVYEVNALREEEDGEIIGLEIIFM